MPLEMGQPIKIAMGPEVAALNCGSGLALAAEISGPWRQKVRLFEITTSGSQGSSMRFVCSFNYIYCDVAFLSECRGREVIRK